jgi:hypothetical protein
MTLMRLDPESSLEEALVRVRNVYTGAEAEIRDVALLTYATPRAPELGGFEASAAGFEQFHVIGDAYAPGSTMAATAHGHRIGNLI